MDRGGGRKKRRKGEAQRCAKQSFREAIDFLSGKPLWKWKECDPGGSVPQSLHTDAEQAPAAALTLPVVQPVHLYEPVCDANLPATQLVQLYNPMMGWGLGLYFRA